MSVSSTLLLGLIVCSLSFCIASWPAERRYSLPLRITSELPMPNVPMDPEIDFEAIIADADTDGVLDPNSIEVLNSRTGEVVPHTLGEGLKYGNRGRVEWVVGDPQHTGFAQNYHHLALDPNLQICII